MSPIDRYLRDKQIELARSLTGRAKIYLDQRFWIIARDAALGIRTGASSRKLLHFLRMGVANGTIVCPIGTSSFLELMKQTFSQSRRIGTATLIDELSLGVTLLPSQSIMGTEIHSLFLNRRGTLTYEMQELIWTKVAYVLGHIHPSLHGVPAEVELSVQKGFADHMWEQSLTDIVATIGNAWPQQERFAETADRINAENAAHAHEIQSYEQTFRHELKGVAEGCAAMTAEIGAHLENRASRSPEQHDWHVQTWLARLCLIVLLIEQPQSRNALRSLAISAALYAASRWDKQRKFKANDIYDFDHAVSALGYCNAFLTEGPLHHLTSEPRLALTELNDCSIISDLDEAVEFLRKVTRLPPSKKP